MFLPVGMLAIPSICLPICQCLSLPVDILVILSVYSLIRQYAHCLASLFLGSTGYWGDNTKGALVVKIGFKPDGLSYIDRGLKAQRIF